MSGDRIEIDPAGLRVLATKMRGAAAMLSDTGRALTARSSPAMPPQVSALVSEVMMRANADLQDLGVELEAEAHTLVARATWAELGGGGAVAWLVPGLYRFRSARGEPLAADVGLAPFTDDEIMRSEGWALEVLEGMVGPVDGSTGEGARLGAAHAPGVTLLEFADGYADAVPVNLGGVSAVAAIDFEGHDHQPEGPAAAVRPGSPGRGSVGGALGAALTLATEGTAALGLAGGLIAGAGDGSGEESG